MANLPLQSVQFFLKRMEEHSCVESCTQLGNEDEFLFEIERASGMSRVNVHLSDAYDYGMGEYLGRPTNIGRGDFIVLAGYVARVDGSVIETARKDGVGIGTVGKLMGALNYRDVWKYKTAEEKALSH